ncbi:hypothetical protein ACLK19_18220 [Escherichia coli]
MRQFNSNTVHEKASQAVETLFSRLSRRGCAAEGVTRFIVAGGDLRRSRARAWA